MPESALWSLIVALIMLALGLALKVAQLTHRFEEISKKSTSTESEIKSLHDKQNEEISNIKQLHATQVQELTDTISDLQSKLSESHNLLDNSKQSEKLVQKELDSLKQHYADTEKMNSSPAYEKLVSENTNLRMANNEFAAKLHEYENPKSKPLPARQIHILKLLFGHDTLPTEQIAQLFDLKLQEAKYHLDELHALKMIKQLSVPYYEDHKSAAGTLRIPHSRSSWTLEHKGRKFLIDNNLT